MFQSKQRGIRRKNYIYFGDTRSGRRWLLQHFGGEVPDQTTIRKFTCRNALRARRHEGILYILSIKSYDKSSIARYQVRRPQTAARRLVPRNFRGNWHERPETIWGNA